MKKIITLAVGLSLLIAVGLFLRGRSPSTSTDSPSAPGDINANAFGDVAKTTDVLEAAPPAAPGSVTDPLSLITPAGSAGSPTIAELELPAPPTGDYELNLTPEQINAIVEKRYGALLRALKLPTDRLARFRSLLAERQQAIVDAANASVVVGLNPIRDVAEIRQAIELVQAPADAGLRSEFGDAVFSTYQEFDRTLGERNAVDAFARSLDTIGDRLRPDQEKQLMQILRTATAGTPAATIDHAIYGATNTRTPISEKAVAAAARVLSPRQLAQFRKLQQQ